MAGQDGWFKYPRPMQGYRAYRPRSFQPQPPPSQPRFDHQLPHNRPMNFIPQTAAVGYPRVRFHEENWGWGGSRSLSPEVPRYPQAPQMTSQFASRVPNPLNNGYREHGIGYQTTYTRSAALGRAHSGSRDEEMTFGDLLDMEPAASLQLQAKISSYRNAPAPSRAPMVRIPEIPIPSTQWTTSNDLMGMAVTRNTPSMPPPAPVVRLPAIPTPATQFAKPCSSTATVVTRNRLDPRPPPAPVVRISEIPLPSSQPAKSKDTTAVAVTRSPPTPPLPPVVRLSAIPTPATQFAIPSSSTATVVVTRNRLDPRPPPAPVVRISEIPLPSSQPAKSKDTTAVAVTRSPPTPPLTPVVGTSEIPNPSSDSTAGTSQSTTPPRASVIHISKSPAIQSQSSEETSTSSPAAVDSVSNSTGFLELVTELFQSNQIQTPTPPAPSPKSEPTVVPTEVLLSSQEKACEAVEPRSPSTECEIVILGLEQNQKDYAVEVMTGLKKKGFGSVGIKYPDQSLTQNDPSFSLYLEELRCPLIFVISAEDVQDQRVTVHVIKGYESASDAIDDANVFEHLNLSSALKLARAKLARLKYIEVDKLAKDFMESEILKQLVAGESLADAEYFHLLDLIVKRWTVQRFLQSKTKYDPQIGVSSTGELQRRVLKAMCLAPPSTTSSIVTTASHCPQVKVKPEPTPMDTSSSDNPVSVESMEES